MSTKLFIGVIVITLVVGLGWYVTSTNNTEDTTHENGDAMMADDESMMDDDAMMPASSADRPAQPAGGDGDDVMMEGESMMKKEGSYEAYSAEKLALAKEGDVVLFFHAPWCPICRAIESEINDDPSQITDGVHILKVDYDTAIALRQKYGVTIQHTFVQVDQNGNAIQKFSDEASLAGVLSRIN